MAQVTSGKVLREARERKNYDLNTVARRLRIRPDILRAIEAGDFSAMPPRGYTRNMVNAYARLLGLNPTEIVNMYLDEAYANQVQRARGTSRGSGFVMGRESRRPRLSSRDAGATRSLDSMAASVRSYSSYEEEEPTSGVRTRSRHLYDDRTQYSRDDYGVTRERVERPGRSDRDFLSHHSGYASGGYSSSSSVRSTRGRGKTIHVGQTPMQYSAPRMPAAFRSRGVLIATIVLAILVVLAVVFVVKGRMASGADEAANVPNISGSSDTTGVSDDSDAGTFEPVPTRALVTYVAKDEMCYVMTTLDDGTTKEEYLDVGDEKSIEVTGTLKIATYTPDYLKVTVDGSEVQLKVDESGEGYYSYTVDFPQILSEWKKAHPSSSSQREAAVAEASNAANEQAKSSSASSQESSASSTDAATGTDGYNSSGYAADGSADGYGTYDDSGNGSYYDTGNGTDGATDYGTNAQY